MKNEIANRKPRLIHAAILVSLVLVVAFSMVIEVVQAAYGPAVELGSAGSFAVLAGSGITVAGAVNSTTITGDMGTHPTTSITGIGNVVLTGTNHAGDAVTQGAKNDLITAYNNAAGRTPVLNTFGDLAGQNLGPGVYALTAPASNLTGTLILDAGGDPTAVFVFKANSTLITSSGSHVQLSGGALACNVFWQVSSSATIGTSTDFKGNIIALDDITLNTSATIAGRVLARNGAVTLDTNTITAPFCNVGSSIAFSPSTITAGGTSTLTITYTNTSSSTADLSGAFTDTLPAGLLIASTPNASTTCTGTGAPTAVAGGSAVTLPSTRTIPGGSIATPGSCTLSVDVTAASAGSYADSLAAGTLTTDRGDNLTATSATLTVTSPTTGTSSSLPGTGFAPGVKSILPKQPVDKAYASLGDLWLEIPRLDVQKPIVGVPSTANGWDVTWLSNQIGWLQGTAFPTWAGNSVLTGHVYDVNGNPGPFGNLNTLRYGDRIIIHAWGQQYIYEVRSTSEVTPNAVSSVIRHEKLPWITLMTCKGYNEKTNSYKSRFLVRAIQVEIE